MTNEKFKMTNEKFKIYNLKFAISRSDDSFRIGKKGE